MRRCRFGQSPVYALAFRYLAHTLLTVSLIRVELTCSFLAVRIAVAAKKKKRFSILSPASYTSSDQMICPNSRW